MSNNPETGGLLQLLKGLISRVSQLDLEKRKSAYRSQAGGHQDITSVLDHHLSRIAASQPAPRAPGSGQQPSAATASKVAAASANHSSGNSATSAGPGVSDFSDYFKSRNGASDTSPYLADKLVNSTWTHIHTAVMHARQGDLVNAKLHAQIANQALKEAAHYMSDEEYAQLSQEIAQAMQQLDVQDH